MIHLLAYTALNAIGATDADTPAVTDPAITVQNNHAVFSVPVKIIGCYALGLNLTRAKISSPKLRQVILPYVRPIERSGTVPQRPNYADLSNAQISLNPIDETAVLLSNNNVATEQDFFGMWVTDTGIKPIQGDVYTLRATTTVTTVANAWTQAVMVFDQTMPAGQYAVVGMDAFATGLIFARLVLPGQVWRPGVIATPATGTFEGDYFHRGYLGELCRFNSFAQPLVEFFSIAAATNPEVNLEVIKVA